MKTKEEMDEIRREMAPVIAELGEKNIKPDTREEDMVGLGDVVEATLNKFGITQERFKKWMGLEECQCTERKKWLNNLFSWYARRKE